MFSKSYSKIFCLTFFSTNISHYFSSNYLNKTITLFLQITKPSIKPTTRMETIPYTYYTILNIRVITKFLKIINSKLNFCIINNRTITEFLNHFLHFFNVELQSRILNFISFNLINNSKFINNSISISKCFEELSL